MKICAEIRVKCYDIYYDGIFFSLKYVFVIEYLFGDYIDGYYFIDGRDAVGGAED